MTDEDAVCVRVVSEVADREGVDPVELTPRLHSVIDTEALDSLFQPTPKRDGGSGFVEFRYQGYLVRVDASGAVEIVEDENSSASHAWSGEESIGD